MADPTPYVVNYSFTGYQATNPADPLPAPNVDDQFAAIQTAISELVDAVKDVRRDDGALNNNLVTLDSLATEVGTRLGVAYESAYDVAVENGFAGSESAWLDSLAATLQIGTVTTSSPGSSAQATITGTAPDYTLNLTLPQGEPGPAGDGSGDMLIATYDPTAVGGDAFLMSNMAEDTDAKIMTAAERTAVGTIGSKFDSGDVASAAEFRNNTADKLLGTDGVWSSTAFVGLTDASTILVDMEAFLNASVTIAANRTLGNPTNPKVGQSGCIKVTASGATRTLAKASNWKSQTAFPISIASGEAAYLFYFVVSSTEIVVSVVGDAA